MVMRCGHAAWSCDADMQHGHAMRTCSTNKQQRHASWTCSMYMQRGPAAWTSGMDMQHDCGMDMQHRERNIHHRQAAWISRMHHRDLYSTCNIDPDMQHRFGNAARTWIFNNNVDMPHGRGQGQAAFTCPCCMPTAVQHIHGHAA